MEYNNYQELIDYLSTFIDTKYLEFNKKIVNTTSDMLGIRTPILRKISKDIIKKDPIKFLNTIENKYFEESILEGLVISNFKDKEEFDKYLEIFIPKINNWATCDMCISTMKQMKKDEKYFLLSKKLINSKEEFKKRSGYIIMLSHFLDSNHIDEILYILNKKEDNNYYYVNMVKAWLISVCFVKFRDKTLKFILDNSLDKFTHNKSIQKIIDSYRVSKDDKLYLKTLKR